MTICWFSANAFSYMDCFFCWFSTNAFSYMDFFFATAVMRWSHRWLLAWIQMAALTDNAIASEWIQMVATASKWIQMAVRMVALTGKATASEWIWMAALTGEATASEWNNALRFIFIWYWWCFQHYQITGTTKWSSFVDMLLASKSAPNILLWGQKKVIGAKKWASW